MKHLLTLILAFVFIFLPLPAQASTITLHVTPTPQYNQGHHFNVSINATGIIPTYDTTSYQAYAMTGYFNSSPTTNYGGAGIYVTQAGVWAYMYISAPLAPVCTPPAYSWFNGRGCLISANGHTLVHPEEQLIELDYYPAPTNEWEAFARDKQNNYAFIGKFYQTQDWFTGINFDTSLQYTTPNNPQYPMYSIWQDPMGWVGGPNWQPFTQASVLLYVSNMSDAFACDDNIYVVERQGLAHAWWGGTGLGLASLKTCSGWLWTS